MTLCGNCGEADLIQGTFVAYEGGYRKNGYLCPDCFVFLKPEEFFDLTEEAKA